MDNDRQEDSEDEQSVQVVMNCSSNNEAVEVQEEKKPSPKKRKSSNSSANDSGNKKQQKKTNKVVSSPALTGILLSRMNSCLSKGYFELEELEKTLNTDAQRSHCSKHKEYFIEIINLKTELKKVVDKLVAS